jgi:hypothetical protein
VRPVTGLWAGTAAAGLALAGCNLSSDAGYVEIRTVPLNARPPVFYLDGAKLDPVRKGVAVLKQRTGTAKLFADGVGGQVALCEIAVRKNRITTVTVSVLDRPPRCQCRNTDRKKACVS